MTPPFVLVHGAWHAGACWQPLVDELERRGERVVAPDLPCEDPDGHRRGLRRRRWSTRPSGFDEPVVVVGHSLGGLTIPLIPERRRWPAWCSWPPSSPCRVGRRARGSGAEAFSAGFPELTAAHQLAGDDGASRWDREASDRRLLPRRPGGAARRRRRRPTGPALDTDPGGLAARRVSRCARCAMWPAPTTGSSAPDWQVRMAKERLGIDAEVIEGSHSPMLARPADLADRLLISPAG